MTDSSTKHRPTGKSPSHTVYHVHEQIGGNTVWTQIGHIWPHDDRYGGTIQIDRAMPSNGRIIFRAANEAVE